MVAGADGYLHEFEHWDFDRVCEEVAFDVILYRGWIPTPELVMWLTRMVREQESGKLDLEG